MTGKEHNRILGILFLAYLGLQILGLLLSIVIIVLMWGFLFQTIPDGEKGIFVFMVIVMAVAFLISILLMIPIGVAAYRLLKEKPSARGWAIAASIIALLNIPFGTAVGIYGLWFLFSEEGKAYYLGVNDPVMLPPPPPNSWQ